MAKPDDPIVHMVVKFRRGHFERGVENLRFAANIIALSWKQYKTFQ